MRNKKAPGGIIIPDTAKKKSKHAAMPEMDKDMY
jgi:co-chaperonin GroES (HSP10)